MQINLNNISTETFKFPWHASVNSIHKLTTDVEADISNLRNITFSALK